MLMNTDNLPIGSCLICSLIKHFGDTNKLADFLSTFAVPFDVSAFGSDLTAGTGSDGFGSGLTNVDRLQLVLSIFDSFFEPSSLDESTELDASEPLSLELSLSFSLVGDLCNK